MSEEQPQWELLPRDPVAFFGLEEPFDRKDLKRKYNRLIKVYKPEKAPEEFKKIRAAYEVLEAWIKPKTDVAESLSPPLVFDDQTYFENRAPEHTVDFSAQGAGPELEQVGAEGEMHRVRSVMTAYAEAMGHEAHEGADPLRFLETLLGGMHENPTDHSIDPLVIVFCELAWDLQTLKQILSLILRYVPQHFARLTLPAWNRYATLVSTQEWQGKLDEVDGLLLLKYPDQVLDFYQNLLYSHWSVVDRAWLNRKIALIEELAQHGDGQQEFHVELLGYLSSYREFDRDLISTHPILAYIHDHLVLYCRDFSEAGARRFQEMHRELLQQGESFFDAFPAGDPRFSLFFRVLNGLSQIAIDTLELELVPQTAQTNLLVFDAHYREMQKGIRGTGAYWRMCLMLAGVVPITLIFGLTMVFNLIQSVTSGLGPAFQLIGLLGLMFCGFLFTSKFLTPQLQPMIVRFHRRFYEEHWRYELIDLIYQTHIPVHELEKLIEEQYSQVGFLNKITLAEMRSDWGLWFYSLSIKFI